MKRLRGLLVLAIIMSAFVPLSCWAQYMGTFSQQTVAQSFTETLTASPTHVSLQNLGQAAQSVTFYGNQAVGDCVMSLDASQDGTNWFLLGSVRLENNADPHGISANGYFVMLRLTFNLESAADCLGAVIHANYAGYQFPVPSSATYSPLGFVQQNLTSPVQMLGSTISAPWQVFSLTCSNPGTAVAYVQMFDSSSAPTLGTAPLFEVGVPASGTLSFAPTLPYTGFTTAWIGAGTTPTGSTAVSTGVVCSEQYTNDTTVWPILRTVSP